MHACLIMKKTDFTVMHTKLTAVDSGVDISQI